MKTIEQFLAAIKHGVDWGVAPEVAAVSADRQYAMVRRPGHSCWSGIGSRGYSPIEHWLIDLSRFDDWRRGYSLYLRCRVDMATGRLPAATKARWQDTYGLRPYP